MTDIVEELRAQCRADHGPRDATSLADDVRWQAAAEIERLRQASTAWEPIETAPKDEGLLLLFCPGLAGQVADEIVIGIWRFDANRRSLGYWVSDVGVLDPGFAETGPWIEYSELHPKLWARLPRPTPDSR
ncbi:MAG: hypothetical protein EPO67_01295 [Reyranella sp.]|jgi:hypothetical protein|nr:MAG: hypothetical protein EPO67_01295 [Reyranella sp.]